MADSQPAQEDEPPYPSYRELAGNFKPVGFRPEVYDRLFWPLDGVFPQAIGVMKDTHGANDPEPFFRPDDAGGQGTWHELADLPLTTPKVSSVEAKVEELDNWEWEWLYYHNDHASVDMGSEYVTYGELDDDVRPFAEHPDSDGDWEADSDTAFLVRCCGSDRPVKKSGRRLKVEASPERGYVTIRDYVGAMHPWLMGMRDDILNAITVTQMGWPYEYLLSEGVMVELSGPTFRMRLKRDWVKEHGPRRPPGPISEGLRAAMAQARRERAEQLARWPELVAAQEAREAEEKEATEQSREGTTKGTDENNAVDESKPAEPSA